MIFFLEGLVGQHIPVALCAVGEPFHFLLLAHGAEIAEAETGVLLPEPYTARMDGSVVSPFAVEIFFVIACEPGGAFIGHLSDGLLGDIHPQTLFPGIMEPHAVFAGGEDTSTAVEGGEPEICLLRR